MTPDASLIEENKHIRQFGESSNSVKVKTNVKQPGSKEPNQSNQLVLPPIPQSRYQNMSIFDRNKQRLEARDRERDKK